MKAVKRSIATLSIFVLVACGGGGGGATTSSATSYTGQYIDAPVKGLSYTASPSGLNGTTDANGNFSFQAGDTVSFNIVTPGGNISAGSIAPATPTSYATTLPVSVMALLNGTQIAQTLQSLGGTGASIDVSITNANVAAITTPAQVTDVNTYVTSGGTAAQPAAITVKATDAMNNALTSIGSISTTAPTPQTVANIVSGATIFHASTLTTATINGKADTSLRQFNGGISYFKPDGKEYFLCVNGSVTQVGNKYDIKNWSSCNETADLTSSTWAVDSTSNKINFSNSKNPSTSIVTLPVIDSVTGLYSQATTASNTTWSGNGLFYIISGSLSNSTFAGKTVTTAGNSSCSDGYMNYVVSSDGASYANTCKTNSAASSKFTSSNGTISSVTNFPGVLQFKDSTTKVSTFVGQVNGGTTSSGKFVVAGVGDTTCYSSSSGNCGYIVVLSYTAK